MYRLKYLNVIRQVSTKEVKDMLIEKGYELIQDTNIDEKELTLVDKLNLMKVDELRILSDKNSIAYDKSIKKDELIQLLVNANITLE